MSGQGHMPKEKLWIIEALTYLILVPIGCAENCTDITQTEFCGVYWILLVLSILHFLCSSMISLLYKLSVLCFVRWRLFIVASTPRHWRRRWEAYTWPAVTGISETGTKPRLGCRCTGKAIHTSNKQEAQLLPSDRAMRLVSSNLANCHATVQKLLIRQVLTKLMVWSWRFSRRQCVMNNVHLTMTRLSRLPLSQVS